MNIKVFSSYEANPENNGLWKYLPVNNIFKVENLRDTYLLHWWFQSVTHFLEEFLNRTWMFKLLGSQIIAIKLLSAHKLEPEDVSTV